MEKFEEFCLHAIPNLALRFLSPVTPCRQGRQEREREPGNEVA